MSQVTISTIAEPRTPALCYIRQSLTRDESVMNSAERQRASITALCEQRQWATWWFTDAEGHCSGYGEAHRPEWRRLKAYLPNPQVVALVANEPSRVYRQMWRMGCLLEELDHLNVQLVFASSTSPVRDSADPRDRFLLQMYALLDEYLVHDISRRQQAALAHRRAEGKTVGVPPFGTVRNAAGYLKASSQGAWVFPGGRAVAGEHDQPPAVDGAVWRSYYACAQRLLTVYAEGERGRARIAQQLNAEGWRFKTRHNQPRQLVEDDVRRVVANWPEYGGLVGDKRAKDRPACAPAPEELSFHLERAVFPVGLLKAVAEVAVTRCQQRPGRGRPSVAMPQALAGLCYCARCEAQARRFGDEKRRTRLNRTESARLTVYRHPARATCGIFNATLPAEHLETEVGRLLDLLCSSDEQLIHMQHRLVLAAFVQPPISVLEARQAIADDQERLARTRQLYLSLDLDRATYQTLTETYRQAVARLQADAHNPTAEALELDYCVTRVRRIQTVWHTGSETERHAALHELFDRLSIDLDTGCIADFRLKPWAEPYLKAWAGYFGLETSPIGLPIQLNVADQGQSLLSDSQVILSRLYAGRALTLYIPISEQRKARDRSLRQRYAAGETLSDLAREFQLSVQRVHQIVQEEHR